MPRLRYEDWKPGREALEAIDRAEAICAEYARQGYDLTLRQLYYQFVARAWIPNTQQSYKRLGDIVNRARLAGYLDWSYIVDRTRNLRGVSHWDSPAEIIEGAARSFRIDKWANQQRRVECLPGEQVIVTSEGMCEIAKVQVGDLVLTHTGRFQPVTKVVVHDYDGPMITIRAVGALPIRVTANHPVWVAHHDQSTPGYKGSTRRFGSWSFDRADSISHFDQLSIPAPTTTVVVDSIVMPAGPRSRELKVDWDADTQAVVGLYLAEGCIRQDRRTVQFTLGAHESENFAAIERWGSRAGLNVRSVVGNGARQVYISCAPLAAWLRANFGCGARQKKFPLWLMQAPVDGQMEVLRWYFRGDGSVDLSRNTLVATTRSRDLAHQVALVLIRCGYLPTVHDTADQGESRFGVQVSGRSDADLMRRWFHEPAKRVRRYNHLRAGDQAAHLPVRSVTTDHHVGPVYNIEVADDHTYCTPVVVHNCWVEKDALAGVVGRVAQQRDVDYFACRGYVSQSELWAAARRHLRYIENGQGVVVLHLGDHDPSGIDMTRDIRERLHQFLDADWLRDHEDDFELDAVRISEIREAMAERVGGFDAIEVRRIALNMDQVEWYEPPPNPAKLTDSRSAGYLATHGYESWELDALDPTVLAALINEHIDEIQDPDLYFDLMQDEERHRLLLERASDRWDELVAVLDRQ